jgi:fucose permease
MAGGGLIFALAGAWPPAVGGAFVLGLGFGGIDYGLNVMVASGFGASSTAMLNILNAHFGLGAVAGPMLLGVLGSRAYPGVFVGGTVVGLLLIPPLWSVRDGTGRGVRESSERKGRANEHPSEHGLEEKPPGPGWAVFGILGAFVGVYILHVGIETGVGGWEPSQLRALGHGSGTAAIATTGFWLAMTVGRFLTAPLSMRLRPPTIVITGCAAMTAFLVLAAVPPLAPYAYLGVGLAIAPIFPTGLIWLGERLPATASAGAWVIAASMIGGVLFPPLLGLAFQGVGVAAVPLLLAALSAGCLALALACRLPRPVTIAKPSNARTTPLKALSRPPRNADDEP